MAVKEDIDLVVVELDNRESCPSQDSKYSLCNYFEGKVAGVDNQEFQGWEHKVLLIPSFKDYMVDHKELDRTFQALVAELEDELECISFFGSHPL